MLLPHAVVAEVPVAPAAADAVLGIATLGAFLAFLVCWGLREGWDATIGYGLRWVASKIRGVDISFGFLGDVHPFGFLADVFEAVDKNVSHALAVAALNTEHAATTLWHLTAEVAIWTGHEIASVARDTYHALERIYGHTLPHAIRHALRVAETVAGHKAAQVARELRHAERAITRDLTHAKRVLAHRIAVAEHAIERALPRIRDLEHDASHLGKRIRSLEKRFGAAAFAGLVVAALARLGLGWLRCPSLNRVANERGCGMWNDLDALLGLATAAIVAADFQELVKEAQRLEPEVASAIHNLWNL